MEIKGIEKDVEQAAVKVLRARLDADNLGIVSVSSLTGGSPGEEPEFPYVFVACRPCEHMGAQTTQWRSELSVDIMTKHTTGNDRDATQMTDVFESVALALDFGNFSEKAQRLGSINVRRLGGEYNIQESTNGATINCELILCG